MILLTITCDLQHPQARGKLACHSRSNRNPEGEGKTPDAAYAAARSVAGHAGWRRRQFKHLGMRMGHVCPACQAIADGEKA